MAYLDLRGAQLDLDITASAGVYRESSLVEEDGTAFNLTNYTLVVVVKDDKEQFRDYGGEHGSETSYSQTITNAANGEFTFYIPPSEFTYKEGGTLTYELYAQDANGNRTGMQWGYINVQERG